MSISNFYDRVVSTQRMVATVGNKKQLATNLQTLSCTIQPSESSVSQVLDGSFYQSYMLICATGLDLKVGDRIIDTSRTFIVKGVEVYDYGKNQHIEALIVEGEI